VAKVSRDTIYREIDRGVLPALHVGRLLRIDPTTSATTSAACLSGLAARDRLTSARKMARIFGPDRINPDPDKPRAGGNGWSIQDVLKSEYTPRTISTFSCDIARPVSAGRRAGGNPDWPTGRRRGHRPRT
jgi:hypothetical protein